MLRLRLHFLELVLSALHAIRSYLSLGIGRIYTARDQLAAQLAWKKSL